MTFELSGHTVEQLAKRINEAHTKAGAAFAAGVGHAITAGALLIEAKAKIDRGDWQAWVGRNCDFSLRTAQAYMRIARNRESLTTKAQRVALLPLRDALALLAEPQKERAAGASLPTEEALQEEVNGFWEDARHTLSVLRLGLENAKTLEQCLAIAAVAGQLQQRAAEFSSRMQRLAGEQINWLRLATGLEDVHTLIDNAELVRACDLEIKRRSNG